MTATPAKTQTKGKRGGLRSTSWKKGQPSPNPAGAPKRGESWAEIIKTYGDMTPSEAAALSLELAKKLLSIGDGVTLKQAVVLRVYADLLHAPTPGLLSAFMERAEGKVQEKLELTGDKEKPLMVKAFDYGTAIAAITRRPEPDSDAPSADKDSDDGAALGKDSDGG